MSSEYFQDKNGREILLEDRVIADGRIVGVVKGLEAIWGTPAACIVCVPGSDLDVRTDPAAIEVIASSEPFKHGTSQPEAPPAEDEGGGSSPVRQAGEAQRYADLFRQLRITETGVKENERQIGRLGVFADTEAGKNEAWRDCVDNALDRLSALEGNGAGNLVALTKLHERVSALENVPPLTIEHHGPEGSRTTVTTGEMSMESPTEPDIIRPMSDSEGEQGETAYAGPEDYDPSEDRCRECHGRWDGLHHNRGSCPALVKPRNSEPSPSRCICVPKLEGRGTGHSRACPNWMDWMAAGLEAGVGHDRGPVAPRPCSSCAGVLRNGGWRHTTDCKGAPGALM